MGRTSGSDDQGYILVALLVGVAIASVWMSAALPSWRQQAIREKEAELIFRGEQYARGILLYSQKMNGALPNNLDDLVSQHTLRKKWKDPITDDEFIPKVGCLNTGPGGIPGGGIPGRGIPGGGIPGGGVPGVGGPARGPIPGTPALPGGGGPIAPRGGRMSMLEGPVTMALASNPQVAGPVPGRPAGPAQQPQPQIPPGGRGPQFPGQIPGQVPGQIPGQQGGQGGICGVQSKSHAASIKIYNGQQEYDLWQFDIQTAGVQFQRSVAKIGGGAAVPGQGIGLPVNMPQFPGGPQAPRGRGGAPGTVANPGPSRGGGQTPQVPQVPFPGGRGRF